MQCPFRSFPDGFPPSNYTLPPDHGAQCPQGCRGSTGPKCERAANPVQATSSSANITLVLSGRYRRRSSSQDTAISTFPVDCMWISLWIFRVVPVAVYLPTDCLIIGHLEGSTIKILVDRLLGVGQYRISRKAERPVALHPLGISNSREGYSPSSSAK